MRLRQPQDDTYIYDNAALLGNVKKACNTNFNFDCQIQEVLDWQLMSKPPCACIERTVLRGWDLNSHPAELLLGLNLDQPSEGLVSFGQFEWEKCIFQLLKLLLDLTQGGGFKVGHQRASSMQMGLDFQRAK